MLVKSILAAGAVMTALSAPLAAPVAAGHTVTLRVSSLEAEISSRGLALTVPEACLEARCSGFEVIVLNAGEPSFRLHA